MSRRVARSPLSLTVDAVDRDQHHAVDKAADDLLRFGSGSRAFERGRKCLNFLA